MGSTTVDYSALLSALYLMMSPAFIIWYGEIPAIKAWGRTLQIGVTCGSLAGMIVLMLLFLYVGVRYDDEIREWWKGKLAKRGSGRRRRWEAEVARGRLTRG